MLDINSFNDLLATGAIITLILTGLVQALKKATGISTRYIPIIATVLGGVSGYFLMQQSPTGIAVGIAMGLSSVGLFETGTKIAGK